MLALTPGIRILLDLTRRSSIGPRHCWAVAMLVLLGLASTADAATLSLRRGESRVYSFEVRPGTERLVVRLQGNNGDADLYLKHGSHPVANWNARNQYASWSTSSNELIQINNPRAGRWFIRVHAFRSFSNVRLSVHRQSETIAFNVTVRSVRIYNGRSDLVFSIRNNSSRDVRFDDVGQIFINGRRYINLANLRDPLIRRNQTHVQRAGIFVDRNGNNRRDNADLDGFNQGRGRLPVSFRVYYYDTRGQERSIRYTGHVNVN